MHWVDRHHFESRVRLPNREQSLRIPERQRTQEHVVDEGENGSVRAYADGKGENGDGRSTRIPADSAKSITEIQQQILNQVPAPCGTRLLLDQRDISELAVCSRTRLIQGHASGDKSIHLFRDVFPDFV
jgi:hypothetical protein